MSPRKPQEPTPEHVAEQATQHVSLPALALIGVFGSETRRAALIRARSGTVQRVIVGDKVAGKQVTAIDIDSVILSKGSRTTVLTLPAT